TYTTAGTYSVRLTVSNAIGSDPEIKTSYITVSPASVAPVAAFTSNKQTGTAPLTIQFTDQSTGTAPLEYAWDFNNDDEVDSEQSNPSFTYTTAGTYTVTLTVTNSAGSDSEIKYSYITVNEVPAAPVADFISNKRSGNAPLEVRFTDSSTHTPTSWAWDFDNNGVVDSTDQNPKFSYSTPATYSVKLTVTNSLGTDEVTKTDYITVNEGQSGGSHAGIALTFDDSSIDKWYAIREKLQNYGAHVTFFVSGYGNLEQGQKDKLLELQNVYGHEIGFHGTHHTEAGTYIQNPPTVQDYIDYDITPGLNQMRNDGLNVVDFAYPGGSDNSNATVALQAYFGHIRDTYYTWDDEINYEYGSNQAFIKGIGIDDLSYGNTIEDIKAGILTAKEEDRILITYGHIPIETATQDYQTSYARLDVILQFVSDNDMEFYTVSELD
ncbi:MAG: PKD domain-containing protein, partial [Methanoregula sp.]|nr:PKD domain-containing protein [Methanoregula sp.]